MLIRFINQLMNNRIDNLRYCNWFRKIFEINREANLDADHTTEDDIKDLDGICDECKKKDESVSQNLILTGFKICKSCRISKTIFPV